MENLWLKATELIVANRNKLLKIIGCRRSPQSIKAMLGDVIWCIHILCDVVRPNEKS